MKYPDIDVKVLQLLRTIKAEVDLDEEYLQDAPYPDWFKDLFGAKVARPEEAAAAGTAEVQRMLEGDQLLDEVVELMEEIKSFGSKIGDQDVSERMAYFRTRAALLEKLMKIKESASDAAQAVSFIAEMIGVMDDLCTPDQRTLVMERLKKWVGNE